jgi:lysozyme
MHRCPCGKYYRNGKWTDQVCPSDLADIRRNDYHIVFWLDDCGCGMIDKVRDMLIRHEGKKNKVYLDTAKPPKKTIGIGHNITDKGLPRAINAFLDEHGYITEEHVNLLFATDIMDAMSACLRLYGQFNTFTEARKAALIDFVFNVGYGTAQTFKRTNAAINGGNWDTAAEGIRRSLYYRQLGGDPPGTDDGKLERPEEIAAMIKTGEWQ